MKRFELGDWFLVGIMCLQCLAILGFVWKRRWLEAVVYLCYMTAQGALILLSLRGRAPL